MFNWGRNKKKEADTSEGFGDSNKFTAKDAAVKVFKMESVDEIKKFTKGDDRKTVFSAADKRMTAIANGDAEKKKTKERKKTPSR